MKPIAGQTNLDVYTLLELMMITIITRCLLSTYHQGRKCFTNNIQWNTTLHNTKCNYNLKYIEKTNPNKNRANLLSNVMNPCRPCLLRCASAITYHHTHRMVLRSVIFSIPKSDKIIHKGLCSQKRNNCSPGICLTTQTWFILLLCKLILTSSKQLINQEKYWKLKLFLFHYHNFLCYSILETQEKLNLSFNPGIRVDWSYSSFKNTDHLVSKFTPAAHQDILRSVIFSTAGIFKRQGPLWCNQEIKILMQN